VFFVQNPFIFFESGRKNENLVYKSALSGYYDMCLKLQNFPAFRCQPGVIMSLKEATLEVIKKLPDDVSAEDIMEKVNFVNQVLEGLAASEAGRSISTEELLKRIEKW
jgi:hypothetical protein